MLRLWGCGQRGSVVHKSTGVRCRAELSGAWCIDRCSLGIEGGQAARPIEDGKPAIRIVVNAHGGLDVVMAMALRRDLPGPPIPADAVVAADLAVLLDAQHVLERPTDIGQEGGSRLGSGHGRSGIVIGHEALLEEDRKSVV